MDTSSSMDPLNESAPLPELSFEDLLDESPVKKHASNIDGSSEFEEPHIDDTLNTPGPKKPPQHLKVAKKPATMTTTPAATAPVTPTATAACSTRVVVTSATGMSTEVSKAAITASAAMMKTPTRYSTTNVSKVVIPAGSSNKGTFVAATATGTVAATTTTTTAAASTTAPIVLNSRHLLNKSIGNAGGTLMKLTPKLTTSTAASTVTPTTTATPTSFLSAGKTAIRTSQGQILYIQKASTTGAPPVCVQTTSGTAAAAAINKSTTTLTSATAAGTTAAMSSAGTRPVPIKVIRAGGGSLLPVKSTTTATTATTNTAMGAAEGGGASAGVSIKTPLTLSPSMASQFAGKRIITTSGGQVVIKTPLRSLSGAAATGVNTAATMSLTTNVSGNTTTSNATATKLISATNTNAKTTTTSPTVKMQLDGATASTPATTVVTTKGTTNIGGGSGVGKIFVQSASGKQIVVSNQNLIKLPAKTATSTGATAVTSTAGTLTSGATTIGSTTQLHTIQLPGKSMQYVRVMPKVGSAIAGTTTMSAAATTTPTTAGAQTSNVATSTIKILNTMMPQKITVVRPSPTTKMVLTQSPKKDGSGVPVTFSPITSKVQKTIVTVPTLRSIGGDIQSTSSVATSNVNTSSSIHSLIRNSQTAVGNTSAIATGNASSPGNVMLRKHKISEINSELQRMTTANEDDDGGAGSGPTEAKKHRIVMLPRSMLRSCVGAGQTAVKQVTVQSAAGTRDYKNGTTTSTSSGTGTGTGTGTGNDTCRDRDAYGQRGMQRGKQQQVYSMLNNNILVATTAARKSLLISGKSQALIAQHQQHHKSLHLKQRTLEQVQAQYAIKPATYAHSNNNNNRNSLSNNSSGSSGISGSGGGSNNRLIGGNNNKNNHLSVRIKVEPPDQQFEIKPTLEDAGGIVRRKHCNCSKSQCLKLYCDCFANGEFCQDCTCKDCFNNLQYEDERQRAIKNCLERNPSAFKPKITTSQEQGDMRHNKGCNCKRSGCLKNYCECYEAKIPCSSNCKCVGCRNFEERPDLDMDPIDPLYALANASLPVAGQKRSYEKANSKIAGCGEKMFKDAGKGLTLGSELIAAGLGGSVGSAGGSSSTCSGSNGAAGAQASEKQQCNFITQEVVDATIQCMISQADECEKNGLPAYQTEKMVMEEMGRCLVEIIDFSIRNTDSSFAQD